MPKSKSSAALEAAKEEGTSFEDLVKASRQAPEFVPSTFEDLERFFEREGIVEVEGSPWEAVDKATLVGKEFVIVHVKFYTGTYGPAVALLCFLREGNRRVVINDGSSGLFQQVKGMVERTGRMGGFYAPKGLRVSTYDYQPVDFDGNPIGNPKPARTYYLA
jgi:hypothetical protein